MQDRYEEAAVYYISAYKIVRKHFGDNHPDSQIFLNYIREAHFLSHVKEDDFDAWLEELTIDAPVTNPDAA
jgi:hypothetical protein